MRKKFFKGFLDWNLVLPAGLPQIFIKLFIGRRVPGSKGSFFQRLLRIGDDLLPVNLDDPAKTLAGRAGAERAVKRAEKGFGVRKVTPAPITGEAPMKGNPLSVLRDQFYFSIPHLKPSLNGFT